jgi:hypothetical protein
MTQHSTNAYMARFRAQFWKIFAAGYAVPLNVTNINGDYKFTGSANLGMLSGGTYTYDGSATPANLQSSYTSKHDSGRFVMWRPVPENPR